MARHASSQLWWLALGSLVATVACQRPAPTHGVAKPPSCPCRRLGATLAASPRPDAGLTSVDSVVRQVAPSLIQLSAPMPSRPGHSPLRVVAGRALQVIRAGPLGTGVLVSPRLVLTAAHVVEYASEIKARLSNGRELNASVVSRAPEHDLVLLRLSADAGDDTPPVPIAQAEPLPGDWVVALGALYARGPTVSVGVVVSRGANPETETQPIELDAAVNLTNTGGPVVNLAGELVGVASAKLTERRGMRGLGYARSARCAVPMLANLTASEGPLRATPPPDPNPLRGVTAANLDEELRVRFAISEDLEHGVVVTEVTPLSPAAELGIEPGDVILEVDFEPVLFDAMFERALADASGPVLVLFVRGNAATYVLVHP